MYRHQDHYFNKAKEQGYTARSAFKLEEIQNKFHLIDKNTKKVLDVGCAPGSWMQYTSKYLTDLWVKDFSILWFDIQQVKVRIPWATTYVQDIMDQEKLRELLVKHKMDQVDFIQSDMAPHTVGLQDIDAIRAFVLLEATLRLYTEILKPGGKFAIKVFMWPGFDEYIATMKKTFWWKNIKIFKPKSCRPESKEIYVIKI